VGVNARFTGSDVTLTRVTTRENSRAGTECARILVIVTGYDPGGVDVLATELDPGTSRRRIGRKTGIRPGGEDRIR